MLFFLIALQDFDDQQELTVFDQPCFRGVELYSTTFLRDIN